MVKRTVKNIKNIEKWQLVCEMEDDDLECRICRGGVEVGTLLHPCKCSGSIRYVHEECIKLWLQRTRTKTCELCHHPFKFSPVYAPDTPSRLPTTIFLLGFLRIFGKHFLILLRLVGYSACSDVVPWL